MTRRCVWILLICCLMWTVSSETSDQMLLALKQRFVNQPDCTPMFEIRHPGYISSNAAEYRSITTDDECRSTCITDEKCMSYQVDSRPGQTFCRIQSSYSIEDLQGPYNAEDVKEYVFTVKCFNITSKVYAGKCDPLIELRLRNWNSYLAREHPSVTSEMECRAICFNDQDCMSYHIDSRPDHPLCYIQKNLEAFNKYALYMGEEVKEYFIVDRCFPKYDISYNEECSPVFMKLYRDISKMATPYPFVTTEQLCRLTCLFQPDCVSYQINRNPGAAFCLIQTNEDNLTQDKRTELDLVTEYVLVNSCTYWPFDKSAPDCTPFVFPKPYPGISANAESHAEVRSYADCRSLCLATPSCVSYQNSSTDILCWTQSVWKSLMPNNAYTTAAVNEYVVARRCSKDPIIIHKFETAAPRLPPGDCKLATLRSESDIVFAICIAGIINGDAKSEERLKALKAFVSDVVDSLDVASNKDRVALVTFDSRAYVGFNLNSYNDPESIKEAIARVKCHECNTREASVVSALATIKAEVLSYPSGYRPHLPHIIILITDRLPTVDLWARDTLVKDLVNSGSYIIPIGVTDMVNGDKLRGLASPTSDGTPQNLMWVNNFASLNTLHDTLHETIRQVLPEKYLRYCL